VNYSFTISIWSTDETTSQYNIQISITLNSSAAVASLALSEDLVIVGTVTGQLSAWKIDQNHSAPVPITQIDVGSSITAVQPNVSTAPTNARLPEEEWSNIKFFQTILSILSNR